MAVYDESGGKRWIAFHSSPDLKRWTFESRIEGFFECPDLFELPVDGSETEPCGCSAADGEYMLGQFDGHGSLRHPQDKLQLWYGNFYAAQTFSDTPGWPSHPDRLGQRNRVPRHALQPADDDSRCELTLRSTARRPADVRRSRSRSWPRSSWVRRRSKERVDRVATIPHVEGARFDFTAEIKAASLAWFDQACDPRSPDHL